MKGPTLKIELTGTQAAAIIKAIEAGIFPDTDTPSLRAAVEKLKRSIK